MPNKKFVKIVSTSILSMAMTLSILSYPHDISAKVLKPTLSLSNMVLQKGQSKTIKIKNVKALKAKWTLTKKKIAALSNKSKKGVTVKGLAKGTTVLKAVIKTAKKTSYTKRVKIAVTENTVNTSATKKPSSTSTTQTALPSAIPTENSAVTVTLPPSNNLDNSTTVPNNTSEPIVTALPAATPSSAPVTADPEAVLSFVFTETDINAYDSKGNKANSSMISGNTITISQPGQYTFSGNCSNGQIIVDVDKTLYPKSDTIDNTVTLSIQGLTLSNTSNSPIYVASIDDECIIQIKKDTENTLEDGTSYTNLDSDMGVIYSKDDLKIKGKGNLTINSNAADGIVCKDDLKIWNGNIKINAADDAVRGKDSVRIGNPDDIGTTDAYSDLNISIEAKGAGIKASNETDDEKGFITVAGGNLSIDSTGDCLHAPGTISIVGGALTLSSGDDGIHSDTTLILGTSGGSDDDFIINVVKSYEGIEAYDIEVYSGKTYVVASDDGFNAAGGNDSSGTTGGDTFQPGGWGGFGGGFGGSSSSGIINMTGGYIYSKANGDGIDSNGNITMTGGTMLVCGPTRGGNGIFDIGDSGCTFTQTGGIIFGMGTSDMAVYPGTTYVNASGTLSPGSIIAVADASGNALAALTVPEDINMSGLVIFSNATATSSQYSVYNGVSYNGTLDDNGYGVGGTVSGGTKMTAGGGSTGGGFGGGNRPGGR